MKPPPGPRGLPLFGSLLDLRRGAHLAIDRMARRYGDVCLLRLGSVPTVVISHPALLKEAFDKPELSDRWLTETMKSQNAHEGLVMAPYGQRWRQLQRFANRELLSARNVDAVRQRYIENVVDNLVERLARPRVQPGAGSGLRRGRGAVGAVPGQVLVSPPEMLIRSACILMFRSIFGRDEDDTAEFDRVRDEMVDYVEWIFSHRAGGNVADYVPLLSLLPNKAARESQRKAEHGRKIIGTLVELAANRPGLDLNNPSSLIDVMLAREAAEGSSRNITRRLCFDLLIAGTDTSAQTVNWFLLLLANRPDVQARIHEEIDRAIGPDALPTVEDRNRLPYTFACLAESMRYRTIGPLGLPHRASEDTEIGGYLASAGTQVLGNIYSIHHDPRFWDSPDEFIPERFLPNEDGSPAEALTGPAYIPFGTGHRRCPGRRFAETTTWLHAARLLHRLRFETPEGAPLSEEETFGLSVTPRPYKLRFSQRP